MTRTEYPEFVKLLSACLAVYGKPAPEQIVVEVWTTALKRFDFGKIRSALTAYPSFGKYAPKPADIVGMLGDGSPDESRALVFQCDFCDRNAVIVFDDARLCGYHHRWKGDVPRRSEVVLALRMTRADVLRDPHMGQRMVDWLSAHSDPLQAAA